VTWCHCYLLADPHGGYPPPGGAPGYPPSNLIPPTTLPPQQPYPPQQPHGSYPNAATPRSLPLSHTPLSNTRRRLTPLTLLPCPRCLPSPLRTGPTLLPPILRLPTLLLPDPPLLLMGRTRQLDTPQRTTEGTLRLQVRSTATVPLSGTGPLSLWRDNVTVPSHCRRMESLLQ